MVIVLHYLTRDTDPIVYGPFPSGDAASRWGFDHCKVGEWHWLPLVAPHA